MVRRTPAEHSCAPDPENRPGATEHRDRDVVREPEPLVAQSFCGVAGSGNNAGYCRVFLSTRPQLEKWRRENPHAVVDPEVYRRQILPGLAAVPPREIIAVTGSSKSSASSYRSGRSIPHPMHWAALAKRSDRDERT